MSSLSLNGRFALRLLVAGLFLLLLCSDRALAQSYRIKPGDVLRIEVLEDETLNRSVLVTPDGQISVPMAGALRVAGLSVDTVNRGLTDQLAKAFANPPNVYVSVERVAANVPRAPAKPRTITVFVMGEAAKPGQLSLPPGANVLQAFAMMGGFTKFAAEKRVQLRRVDASSGAETIHALNYRRIEAGGPSGRTKLRDGDVILVPERRLFE